MDQISRARCQRVAICATEEEETVYQGGAIAYSGEESGLAVISAGILNGIRNAMVCIHLQPGESLTSFNRRVEDNMRPQIRLAVQSGQANARRQDIQEKKERRQRKEGKGVKDEAEEGTEANVKKPTGATPSSELFAATKTGNKKGENAHVIQMAPKGKTEFDTLSSRKPKRLNNIVDAPPDMLAILKKNKVLQKTAKGGELFGKKDVVPPEQKGMMEVEREKAIRQYREMKEKRQDA